MKTVKLSKKFQIAIPKEIRNELKLSYGDKLEIDSDKDRIVLIPLPKDYAEYTRGLNSSVWDNVDIDGFVRKERKNWDK